MGFLVRGVQNLVAKFGRLSEALILAQAGKVDITSDAPYFDFVIKGTRPHMIYPRDAMALASADGSFGPVAQAFHPGTAPNDFVKRAAEKAKPLLVAEYRAMVGEGLLLGAVRAEAAKIVVGETLLRIAREEAPYDTGALAHGLGLVGSMGDLL